MAHGEKYRVNWYDLLGNNKRVDILEEDYSGSVTTVRGSADPVFTAWDPDLDTKYPVFKASSADIHLMSPSRLYFRTLFTSNKFKYLVKYYSGGSVIWTGYLLPDLYQEPYDYSNYPVNFKATDGLGLLKNIDFVDDDGDYYTGLKSDLDIIVICLDKLGLDLNIYTAIDIYETNMTTGTNYDPLTQAYTNCDIFRDKDCAYVLREILKVYGAFIYQQDNTWNITRASLLNGDSFTRRLYNSSGVFQSAASHDPGITLTNTSAAKANRNVLVMERTTLEIVPGIKQLEIYHDYGLKSNILPGGNFTDDEFDLTASPIDNLYWNDKQNLFDFDAHGEFLDHVNGECAIYMNPMPDEADYPVITQHRYFENQELELAADSDVRFSITFDYKIVAERTTYSGNEYTYPVKLFAYVELGSYILRRDGWKAKSGYSGAGLYLNLSGFYDNNDNVKEIPSNSGWQSITFEADTIPASDTLLIRIFQPLGRDASYINETFKLFVKGVKIKILNDNDPIDSDITLTTIVDDNNNYIPERIEVLAADLPDITNNDVIYSNGKFLSDGTPTKLWQVTGSSIQEPLIVALGRMITDQYLRPSLLYNGVVLDSHIKIGSVVEDPWDNLNFVVKEITSSNEGTNEMQLMLAEYIDDQVLMTESDEEITTEADVNILTG